MQDPILTLYGSTLFIGIPTEDGIRLRKLPKCPIGIEDVPTESRRYPIERPQPPPVSDRLLAKARKEPPWIG